MSPTNVPPNDEKNLSENGERNRTSDWSKLGVRFIVAMLLINAGSWARAGKHLMTSILVSDYFATAFIIVVLSRYVGYRANPSEQPALGKCGNNLECANIKYASVHRLESCSMIFIGMYRVPLDYFNQSAGSASLSVIRYLATDRKNRIGSLFVNPGGPGGSGVEFLHNTGKEISLIVGGRHDIVGIVDIVDSNSFTRFNYYMSTPGQLGSPRNQRDNVRWPLSSLCYKG